jgi:DNA-directed RNA polymerase specialized sigma24 family protein
MGVTILSNKLTKLKGIINPMAEEIISETTLPERKEELQNELYILIHNTLKRDYHLTAQGLLADQWDVEALYADTFMNVIKKFRGGDFVNMYSNAAKNLRKNLLRNNNRKSKRVGLVDTVSSKKGDNDTSETDTLTKLSGQAVKGDEELFVKHANADTRRAIITYLVECSGDEITTKIVQNWLNDDGSDKNILKVANRLGISNSTARRRIMKLKDYYNEEAVLEFGDIETYL